MTRWITRSRILIGALAATAGFAVAAQLASQSQAPAAQHRPPQDLRVQRDDARALEQQTARPQRTAPLAQAAEVKVGLPAGRRAGL